MGRTLDWEIGENSQTIRSRVEFSGWNEFLKDAPKLKAIWSFGVTVDFALPRNALLVTLSSLRFRHPPNLGVAGGICCGRSLGFSSNGRVLRFNARKLHSLVF